MYSILIVEDEKEIRSNLVELFEAESYMVYSAKDGLEGVEKALKHLPDIILSDIKMPNLNGLDFFQRLKDYPETRSIPFIFLSAKAELQDFRAGMSLGADDYLIKPINIDEILATVKTRLQKKNIEREELEEFKNTLIRKVPHEMRTPLVGIIGFSELLTDDLDSLPKEEIKNMLTMIRNSGHRLQRRVEKFLCLAELLSYERENKKNGVLEKYSIDERIIYHEMLPLLEDVKRVKDVTLSFEKKDINLTEKYFLVVIRELLENAMKFSPTNTKISIKGVVKSKAYRIQAINYGPEIPVSVLNRVTSFKQFVQDKDFYEGLGLGLTIIYKTAHMSGGYLKADRTDSGKTIIEVGLPLD